MPGHFVFFLVLQDVLCSAVRGDVDPLRHGGWAVEAEVLDTAEVGQDPLGLARYCTEEGEGQFSIRIFVGVEGVNDTYRTWGNGRMRSLA